MGEVAVIAGTVRNKMATEVLTAPLKLAVPGSFRSDGKANSGVNLGLAPRHAGDGVAVSEPFVDVFDGGQPDVSGIETYGGEILVRDVHPSEVSGLCRRFENLVRLPAEIAGSRLAPSRMRGIGRNDADSEGVGDEDPLRAAGGFGESERGGQIRIAEADFGVVVDRIQWLNRIRTTRL